MRDPMAPDTGTTLRKALLERPDLTASGDPVRRRAASAGDWRPADDGAARDRDLGVHPRR